MLSFTHTIIFVSDMPRSVAFYRDVLGLALRFDSEWWSEFETGATRLCLHKANTGEPGTPTARGTCHIGLAAADLDAFHVRMLAAGTHVVEAPKMQEFGARMATYADPDGLCINVAELH